MDIAIKQKWQPEKGLTFSERNINRWSIYGSRNTRIERILKRENENGAVVETCQIGAVGYKGKLWSLSSIHGRLMNIIEMLFYRQGMPADNTIRISSMALYNFLADIATLFHPDQMKNRDGNRFRDWIYDTLHVLAQVTIMFSSWEKKDGSKGAYGLKLIKSFKMWGKDQGAEWGMIIITIDPEFADGLRARNTAPILIEVENSIKSDNGFALYRYLRQVLFKTPLFECDIEELHERLAIGRNRKNNMVEDFRDAAKEIEMKQIPNGRIVECRVENKNRKWVLIAKRGVSVERRLAVADAVDESRRASDQRERDQRIEESAYLRHFDELPMAEKEKIEKEIAALVQERRGKNGIGSVEMHTRIATLELMERYVRHKSDGLFARICSPGLIAREKDNSHYIGKYQRAAIQSLAQTLARYSALKQGAI